MEPHRKRKRKKEKSMVEVETGRHRFKLYFATGFLCDYRQLVSLTGIQQG